MSLVVHCERCGEELNEPGGLLISPPQWDRCIKSHLCSACYTNVWQSIDFVRQDPAERA